MLDTADLYPIVWIFEPGDLGEMIAYRLHTLFQEKLSWPDIEDQHDFKRRQQRRKCVINIFSWDIDPLAMIHHPWTYLPLLDDVIGIDDSSGRNITVKVEENKSVVDKTYSIDYTDHVLQEHGLKPIDDVGQTIDE